MPTRYVPLSSFDRMERLVDGLLSSGKAYPRNDRQIPVDAIQRDGELVLHFDLPGVAEDTVELSIERRVLSVRAERGYTPEEGDIVFFAERPWGQFSRQIVLSDSLDTDRVHALMDNGVLTVTIPVSPQAKSRKIDITHAPLRAGSREVTARDPAAEAEPATT